MRCLRFLVVLMSFLLLFALRDARADFITILGVSSSGTASAVSGLDFQNWNETTFGSYSASASAVDPGPPSGAHSASASATLAFFSGNSLQLSGSASASAGTDLTGFIATSASSFSYINFSTSSTFMFSLTGSETGFGQIGLTGSTFTGVLNIGSSLTLSPGTYQLAAVADAIDTSKGGPSQFQSFSGTLTVTAVPEPSSFVLGLSAVSGAALLRYRRRRA